MHDIRFIRDNPDVFDKRLRAVGSTAGEMLAQIALLDDQRADAAIAKVRKWQEDRTRASKEIGKPKRAETKRKAKELMAGSCKAEESILQMDAEHKSPIRGGLVSSERSLRKFQTCRSTKYLMAKMRKTTSSIIISGRSAITPSRRSSISNSAKRSARWISRLRRNYQVRGLLILKKGLARLERALGQFFLDVHTSDPHNYVEVAPPLLVRDEVMFGTAQLPKFQEDQFRGGAALSNAH